MKSKRRQILGEFRENTTYLLAIDPRYVDPDLLRMAETIKLPKGCRAIMVPVHIEAGKVASVLVEGLENIKQFVAEIEGKKVIL